MYSNIAISLQKWYMGATEERDPQLGGHSLTGRIPPFVANAASLVSEIGRKRQSEGNGTHCLRQGRVVL